MNAPFTDIESLAKERLHPGGELFFENAFYGNARVLKRYAGFPDDYPIKAAMEHGAHLGAPAPMEQHAELPAIIAYESAGFPELRQATPKALFAVGAIIQYASPFLTEEQTQSERQRLGRNLLVFPAHSSHYLDANYDTATLCSTVKKIASSFDSVRVCLYWKDVLRERAAFYRRQGFECVTAGHMYDQDFLSRLKSIIQTATMTMSNQISSHIGYCTLLGKPHFYLRSSVQKNILAEYRREDMVRNLNRLAPAVEIGRAFAVYRNSITPEQQSLVNKYWGIDDTKSAEEIRDILSFSEDMYRRGSRFFLSGRKVMLDMAVFYLNSGKKREAERLLRFATEVYPELPTLRAVLNKLTAVDAVQGIE